MARILTPNIAYNTIGSGDLFTPFWGMERLNEVVQEAGWGGIEFTDVRMRHARQLRRADPDTAAHLGRNIFSMYEGWRQPPGAPPEFNSWRKANILTHMLSTAAFPPGPQTLATAQRIEQSLRRPAPLPYILYAAPSGRVTDDRNKAANFDGARVQPTPDLAVRWGANTPAKLIVAYKKRGYKVEVASFNSDRKGRNSDGEMHLSEYLEPLLDSGLVKGVSISGARPDFDKADQERVKTAEKEAAALIGRRPAGFSDLPLDALFTALRERQWEGDVTVRYPIGAFAPFVGKVTLEKVIETQRTLIGVIKEQLPHIRWETLPDTR